MVPAKSQALTLKIGRPTIGETREPLIYLTFKADERTLFALDKLEEKLGRGRSAAVRWAIADSAARPSSRLIGTVSWAKSEGHGQLVRVGFKADPKTLLALEKLETLLSPSVLHRRSATIRRAIIDAAGRILDVPVGLEKR